MFYIVLSLVIIFLLCGVCIDHDRISFCTTILFTTETDGNRYVTKWGVLTDDGRQKNKKKKKGHYKGPR